jgi:hypothetical protein
VELEKDAEDHSDRSCESEEVLHRVKDERNILHTVNIRKANWMGHNLSRNCLLRHVFDGR